MKLLLIMLAITTNVFADTIESYIFEIRSGSFESDFHFRKTGSSSIVSIKNKKYLLTNYHVCTNDSYNMRLLGDQIPFEIKNHKNKTSISFFVKKSSIVFDESEDLCLIPIGNFSELNKLKGLAIARSQETKNLTLASPYRFNNIVKNIQVLEKDNPTTSIIPKEDGYKINFPIELGMSGSPILNNKNEIVMIVWGRYDFQKEGITGLTIGTDSLNRMIKLIQ